MSVTVACLGAGYFARFHYDAWARVPGARLVGAADRDLDRAAATGVAPFADLGDMLSRTSPDVLDIITPPETHGDAIHIALSHGVGTIICQKPFTSGLEEGRRVVDAAEKVGVDLIIHDNFRFQPWYRVMRAALDAGDIGDPRQLTFRLRTGDGRGPDAYLARQPYFQSAPRLLVRETAVHWIDTFRYLMGEPLGIYADLRRENPAIAGEDAGYLLFDYPSGARALFDGNRLLDHKTPDGRLTFGEALFEGTDATLTLYGDGSVTRRAFGAADETVILDVNRYAGFAGDCVYALNAHVIAALEGEGTLENRARDYLRVHELEEAAYLSAAEGRRIAL